MKDNYLRLTLMGLAMVAAATLRAIDYPTYPTQTVTDGGKYVLCNLANPTGYLSRTGWDGAYYFLGETDSKYQTHAFTAQLAEDGRWLFITGESEQTVEDEDGNPVVEKVATYMGYPVGMDNLNGNLTEEAYFELLPGTVEGFYQVKASDGQQNAMTIGVRLHLNSDGQYLVASEPTNGWYPDYYGGILYEEDGVTPIVVEDENGVEWKVPADETSFNWAFVLVEDVPTFVLLGNAYSFMGNYEKNYCAIEEYATGFQATLAAVLPRYKVIASQEDFDAVKAMVQAKIDLYNQIVKAEDLETATLTAAIEAAKTTFDTQTDTEAVNAALETLKKACDDYIKGQSDITSMGQNMSFEDLSAQNGNESSSVSPAPRGWTVYVNGEAMEEGATNLVSNFNWHGVNSDCSGYKDGNVGFGIWAPTIPEYEISQTITGLENGTYTITAGMMYSYGRTTQRIFGNLNSTLMAYEDEYAEGILPAEYKSYAGLMQGPDERTMQELSVRAYVYDGTLRFGVKTNNDFAAALRETGIGGDGWFKVDNFTITKEGFVGSDQSDLYDYLYSTLTRLAAQPMDANYKGRYEATYDNLDEGIAAMVAMIPEAQEQADAYKPLGEAIGKAYEDAWACEEAGYAGTDDFYDFIDAVNDKYQDGEYTADEIAAAVAALEEAYQECLRSGVDEGADVSDLILNRSFENLSSQGGNNTDGTANPPYGWDIYVNGVKCETAEELREQGLNGWCAINSGDGINIEENGTTYTHQYTDGTHLWGIWNGSMPQIELSQTITGLKPGTYQLTADVMADGNTWAGNNLTTQRIFAQDVVCLYGLSDYDYNPEVLQGTTSDDVYQAWAKQQAGLLLDEENEYEFINYGDYDATQNGSLLRTLVLHFGVGEDGTAKIGFRTDNLDAQTGEAKMSTVNPEERGNGYGWFKVDNFTLFYESSQIPTGIETLRDGENETMRKADNALYDLSGRRVGGDASQRRNMPKGLYIQGGKKVVRY